MDSEEWLIGWGVQDVPHRVLFYLQPAWLGGFCEPHDPLMPLNSPGRAPARLRGLMVVRSGWFTLKGTIELTDRVERVKRAMTAG